MDHRLYCATTVGMCSEVDSRSPRYKVEFPKGVTGYLNVSARLSSYVCERPMEGRAVVHFDASASLRCSSGDYISTRGSITPTGLRRYVYWHMEHPLEARTAIGC